MSPPPRVEPETLPLFKGLDASVRAMLLRHAMVQTVAPNTVLFEQGLTPTFQPVVLEGSVHLFGRASRGGEVLVDIVEPPELVVPAAVMTAAPYLVEARTQAPSRLLLLQAQAFREAVEQHPALGQAVIRSLSGQFRRMVRQVKNLKLRPANQRVGCYVLALARRQGAEVVTLPYEKTLIASELGMTRESFSRALSLLQKHGVAMRGDTLRIVDRPRLEAFAEPDPLIDPDETGLE